MFELRHKFVGSRMCFPGGVAASRSLLNTCALGRLTLTVRVRPTLPLGTESMPRTLLPHRARLLKSKRNLVLQSHRQTCLGRPSVSPSPAAPPRPAAPGHSSNMPCQTERHSKNGGGSLQPLSPRSLKRIESRKCRPSVYRGATNLTTLTG